MPAAASNPKPAPRVTQRTVSSKEAQHSSSPLTRAVPRKVWLSFTLRKDAMSARGLAPTARPWCDVPAVVFNTKPAPRATQRRRTCALCFWGGGAALGLATRTRRGALVLVVTQSVERRDVGERPRSYGARPWCDVPAVVFNTKPAPHVTQRRRTCALCFLGGGAARELAIRARRGALVMLGRCFVEERHAGERHLSFGVWPWCDVLAAASNAKPAPRVSRGAGAPALSVSREEARYTSFLRARAVLHCVWSYAAL